MPKDIVVVVNIDAKPKAAENLNILLLSTQGTKELKTYRALSDIAEDFGHSSQVYNMALALFNQGKTTLADNLIRKVKIVGIEEATGETLIQSVKKIQEMDNDWYLLLTDRTDDESVKALSAWAEASEPTEAELGAGIEDHRKLYFGQTDNKELTVSNRRSILIYTDHLEEHADAAWVGNVGPHYPESVTWKFKRPQGITLPELTDGEREVLEEAHINFLSTEYKREYVKNGVCADGEFIDVQMGADYIVKLMRENLYDVMLSHAKVPYTDEGFALVAGAVFSALNQAVRLGIIAQDPESRQGIFSVAVPKRYEATDEAAAARRMPDITWEAQLDGAVHSIKIQGTLRANLAE